MNQPDELQRHLSLEGFNEYLQTGVPAVVKIDGSPVVYLVIDPRLQKLALRTPLQRHSVPDLTQYRHMSAGSLYWNDAQWCELRIDGDIITDAYPIICTIADRIQLRSMDFGAAVTDALVSLRELLVGAGRLSEEQEIGLFGELLLLKHLLRQLSSVEAIAAWHGPMGEEHDFVLRDIDVEVKSTIAERRTHWVNDLRQLEPKLDRKLLLLSFQMTAAGAGGSSLSELIAKIRTSIPVGEASAIFDQQLERLNWNAAAQALYTRRFQLRKAPAVYQIDDSFPALTSRRLEAAGFELNRFFQVRYSIDLTGLPALSDAPDLLRNFGLGE